MSNSYFTEQDDGLTVRLASDRTMDSLRLLWAYVDGYTRDAHRHRQIPLNYIDLWAGPGKTKLSPGGTILLASPLIAFTVPKPFNHCYFAETTSPERTALVQRVQASERRETVTIYSEDGNEAVDKVLTVLPEGTHLVFLALDKLQVQWATVEKFTRLTGVELIFDLSKVQLGKVSDIMHSSEKQAQWEAFFGSSEWRKVYQQVARQKEAEKHQALLSHYLERLSTLGLVHQRTLLSSGVYHYLAASPTPLRSGLWDAALQHIRQKRLF